MNNQTIDNLIPSCFRCERVEQAKCIDVTAEAINKITLLEFHHNQTRP